MAITRRQFVTRLGALAAAAGFSQSQASPRSWRRLRTTPLALAYQGTFGKPRVVWIHGAECTGCSTSLLGIFENLTGEAIPRHRHHHRCRSWARRHAADHGEMAPPATAPADCSLPALGV